MEHRSEYCISVEEMGRRLGISRIRACELASSNGFPAVRFGRRILIPIESLKRWLEEQSVSK